MQEMNGAFTCRELQGLLVDYAEVPVVAKVPWLLLTIPF